MGAVSHYRWPEVSRTGVTHLDGSVGVGRTVLASANADLTTPVTPEIAP
jgi:hypothetical protein